ncbi:MAG: Tetratricopeptide repeat protein [Parcubacteria group bacterium GW2011_GWA2_51_10]|nr:MAG: Tetratricopeptide repeat protein [Parcubacteria group bacterium GW2011_GWA2_51_10]
MTKNNQFIVIVGIVIVLLVGAFLFSRSGGLLSNAPPSLDRPTVFPADFAENARTVYTENLAKIKESIETNPENTAAWLDLAIYYKMVNDYEGALEVWEYLVAKNPSDAISLHNIAEYHFHTKKDYPAAERYYRKAIEANPSLSMNYSDLHEMYRYVYKQDTDSAIEILKEGISKVDVRGSIDLTTMLARYFEDKGDLPNARTYYTQARDMAKGIKETQIMQQLDLEISRVSQ